MIQQLCSRKEICFKATGLVAVTMHEQVYVIYRMLLILRGAKKSEPSVFYFLHNIRIEQCGSVSEIRHFSFCDFT